MTADLKKAKKLKVSLSLEKQSLYHVQFLQTVDRHGDLKHPALLRRALYRYERFWLPLAADHEKEKLTAPIDIEWLWHCHLLCPTAYVKDCKAVVGVVNDHTLKNSQQFQSDQSHSKNLWMKAYPTEPFDVTINDRFDTLDMERFISKISYNLLEAAKRQAVFYYQVSLPHFRDEKFLRSAMKRYKQFLYLKTQLPKEFLVPCYDIDLIWHSHQLNPLAYAKDMDHIIGNLFNHDDTVNDRSEGSKLMVSDKSTRAHWKAFYNEKFALFGAMYRGMPPQGFLYKVTHDELMSFTTKKCNVTVDSITLRHPDLTATNYKNYSMECVAAIDNKHSRKWFKSKSGIYGQEQNNKLWSKLGKFQFHTKNENNLLFGVYEEAGFAFCKSKITTGLGSFDIIPYVENCSPGAPHKDTAISETLQMGTCSVDLKMWSSPFQPEGTLLFLEQDRYVNYTMPEDIQQLWGPLVFSRLPPDTVNTPCQIASHGLKNHTGVRYFTARIIHSAPLMMSAVQVFYQDKMTAIGHLVASDQLPIPTQVKRDEVTLNPRLGERAVLIKNNAGDWAIVTGHWKGMKKGVAGTSQKRGVPGSPGSLYIKVYKMYTGKTTHHPLGYLNNNFILKTGDLEVDLMKGIIKIDSTNNEIPEHIALAFSVSLLHVLCVPRPKDWKEGQQVKTNPTTRGTKAMKSIPSDDMAFIVAAGLHFNSPCNHYKYTLYGPQQRARRARRRSSQESDELDLDELEDALAEAIGECCDDGGDGCADGGDGGCGGCGGCGGGGSGCGGGDCGGCGGD